MGCDEVATEVLNDELLCEASVSGCMSSNLKNIGLSEGVAVRYRGEYVSMNPGRSDDPACEETSETGV